ncbi:hypothetical protein RN001_011211 [Aquatica leii]|uniref:Peptidase S1 domain-containing protein n=1 Tax=Aquatica leii TaxID=1421715 RepID=A0AAN7Q3X0_9COLE|nr:hypothetical protein RN001_011211 [Aquatica leii]
MIYHDGKQPFWNKLIVLLLQTSFTMSYYIVVNILLLVITFNGNSDGALNKRIVNGTTTADGQFPYQVSLTLNGQHLCGGSILNTRWILTSPYCFIVLITFKAVVGTNALNANGDIYQVESYIKHPLFNPNTKDYAAGLLNTTTPIVYSNKVQPIALTPLLPIDGTVAVVAGWGPNDPSSEIPINTLTSLKTTVINYTNCQNRLLSKNFTLTSTHICTFVEQAGICSYDYGGAVSVCNLQFGIALIPNCGTGFPDIHTKISSVYSWILYII